MSLTPVATRGAVTSAAVPLSSRFACRSVKPNIPPSRIRPTPGYGLSSVDTGVGVSHPPSWCTSSRSRGRGPTIVVASSASRGGAANVAAAAAGVAPATWWAKQKELWTEIEDEKHYYELVDNAGADGKLLVIDYYATWCHACQRVYPTLCLIAEDPKLRKQIVFAKMQVDKHKKLVKQEGITVLPFLRCYGKGGLVFEGSAAPTKVKKLRGNLETALSEPGMTYFMDEVGVIQPETDDMIERRSEKKAAAKARTDRAASKSNIPAVSPVPSPAPATNTPAPTLSTVKADFLAEYKDSYGYGGRIDELYAKEVGCRLQPHEHYMDYTAAALYTNSVIDAAMAELKSHVFGNPHSAAPSSVLTDTKVEEVRDRILKYFNADPAEYQCVFTRGATASLKMVGETFPWSSRSRFVYLRENHNSVLGQREYALAHGASFKAVDEEWVNEWVEKDELEADTHSTNGTGMETAPAYNLFAFPGEDNFAGVKYPLDWVKGVQAKSGNGEEWKVMLDAAAFVPSNPLDLSEVPADFVAISFYKMFGYPTGIGALLVRTENIDIMQKVFWGGGSVSLATSDNNFHVLKCKPSERLEDGTISFLDVIALNHGFDFVDSLGGVKAIQAHVTSLSDYLYNQLSHLQHSNGEPMATVFGKHSHSNRHDVQGGIVNFELIGADGYPLSYREFQDAAGAAGFHIRTGAECNPGACYKYLGINSEEVQQLAGLKEGCNDDVEYINVQRNADFHSLGQELSSEDVLAALETTKVPLGHIGEIAMKWIKVPLGSVRVSLGFMSTFEDVQALLDFITTRYRNKTSGALASGQ